MGKIMEFETIHPRCGECEAALADALDGALSPQEQRRFDEHIGTCTRCSAMLDEAQRGATWLEMLRSSRPEPTAALLERILAETSGRTAFDVVGEVGLTVPETIGWPSVPALPERSGNVFAFPSSLAANARFQSLRYHLLQPRLAMTAAMAFFSVALTLSLAGVRLNEIHASDLGPAGMRRAVYGTEARAARYYGNLKVVYVMESRLEDLRRNREDDRTLPPADSSQHGASSTPKAEPRPESNQPAPRQAPEPGTSRKETPATRTSRVRLHRVGEVSTEEQQPLRTIALLEAGSFNSAGRGVIRD